MKVLERAAGHASGPYRVPNIDVHAVAVRTNNPVCGAFRGFGANQAQFGMEGVLDRLAAQVGISGWEIRKRNVIHPGEVWGPGQIMDDGCAGADACLDAVKPLYDAAREQGRAVGLGLGLKNSGLGNGFREISRAVVRVRDGGRVEVRHGWTEMGQGVHTVALQVAAQELGIAPERIDVIVDTTHELGFGQTTGSRGTLMAAGSVQQACLAALAGGCALEVDYEGEHLVDWTQHLSDPDHPNPTIHAAFGYAAQMVEIDRTSGKIERVVAIHDVGKAVNPLLCEGQIEGSVHMGLGYALTEDFPSDPETGFPTNMTLRSLGIIRPKDVPHIDVELIEVPQPRSPTTSDSSSSASAALRSARAPNRSVRSASHSALAVAKKACVPARRAEITASMRAASCNEAGVLPRAARTISHNPRISVGSERFRRYQRLAPSARDAIQLWSARILRWRLTVLCGSCSAVASSPTVSSCRSNAESSRHRVASASSTIWS
jgi:CO/xanthine dehydrogenase Mo-binding subunit